MNPLLVSELVAMTGGKLLSGEPQALASGVCTDSRQVRKGDVFFALRGEKFDGHHFLADTAAAGAAVLIVDDYPTAQPNDSAVILVTDTLLALQNLARNYRRQLKCKIVAITGSNGKTSTKDLTAAALSSAFAVSKTRGNLNNHIGLPLSVLAIENRHGVAILEIGMNHPGEIAPLARIAQPDIAIITNIGIAHIEYLGSREAIAAEKSALADAIATEGTVILNADDDFTETIATRCRARVLTGGLQKGDVRVSNLASTAEGSHFDLTYSGEKTPAFLPIPGRHMALNAALAVAAGLALGISLENAAAALAAVELTGGRLQSKELGGLHFLDDTYNANPESMIAALETLREMPETGQKIAVLGAMGELGHFAAEGYRQVGRAVPDLDFLITVGPLAAAIAEEAGKLPEVQIYCADEVEQAVSFLQSHAREGDWILVKGSRSARLERVVEAFEHSACLC